MKSSKIYIVISAIIQIIFAIFLIVSAENIVYEYNLAFQEDLAEYAITEGYVRTISAAVIGINIIISLVVLKSGIESKKGVLIILSTISFMILASYGNIVPLLPIINIIVVACVKRNKSKQTKVKFNVKEAEECLRVEKTAMTKKEMVLAISILVVYLIQLISESILPKSPLFILFFVIAIYVALFVLALMAFWREIKQGFITIKENFKKYSKYLLRVFGVMFAIYYLAIITTFFVVDQTDPINQQILEMMPWYIVAPIAIIWAPIVEEVIFRGIARKVIKNDILYIVVSGGIFGLMHTLGEATLSLAIATALPYAVLGGAFAYMYAKTNNLTGNIIAHSVYNMVGVMFMMLG